MKRVCLTQILVGLAVAAAATSSIANDAVELYLDDAYRQIRVEALDPGSGNWVAIASGYREHEDPGWLKIAIPEAYADAQMRLIGSSWPSPFAGHIESPLTATGELVGQLPGDPRSVWFEDGTGGGESDIEEADIWAMDGEILYFYNQYRGLQVLDLADPSQPLWVDYFRYPAKGEDLYVLEDGRIILIGSGAYWSESSTSLNFLSLSGGTLSLLESVDLEAGQYLDSRRNGDYLYVMTREWEDETNPMGEVSQRPVIRLYTVSLHLERQQVLDVKTFAGSGWFDAVLTAQPEGILISVNRWQGGNASWRWRSEVHVMVPNEAGIPERVGVAPLAGLLRDKDKMQFSGGILTTVSQQADWTSGNLSQVTRLENFSLDSDGFSLVGALDLAPGESLFATRFHEDVVYVVTFLFVDPLFAIDNRDPARPRVAGELEVPGWSDHLEWVDDRLFAIGPEDGRLSASIFDVSDPANMFLLDRVYLSEDSWSGSEAQYDDRAIAFYPERNLFMLPFNAWSWERNDRITALQLISWDSDGLDLRGRIQHVDTPRRGSLMGDTLVSVSGRELVTTDISDKDLPQSIGRSPLAWPAQRLIVLDEYILQLELPGLSDGYWYWEVPYRDNLWESPRMVVTTRQEPNVPVAEILLKPGRVVGSAFLNNRLLLLQDTSDEPASDYWELPEVQSLAVRMYSVDDPLAPVLMGEDVAEELPYLGSSFAAHVFDNSIVWASDSTWDFGIFYLDIWPGPWFLPSEPSFIVSTIGSQIDTVSFGEHKVFSSTANWGNASSWHRAGPLMVASVSDYQPEETADGPPEYVMKSRLVAVDFTNPLFPLQLPEVTLPANLSALLQVGDGINHYLYLEPVHDVIEVWGWDRASAFRLFRWELEREDPTTSGSWSMAWLPPFHVRQRSDYESGKTIAHLDVFGHLRGENRLGLMDTVTFEDEWVRGQAVLGSRFLVTDNDELHLFEGLDNGTVLEFPLLESHLLPFPEIHSLNLVETVFLAEEALIPAGIYGVERLPIAAATGTAHRTAGEHTADGVDTWHVLEETRWRWTDREGRSEAGVIKDFAWLYLPESTPEIDPSAEDLGDLWRASAWFGHYAHHSSDPSWIRHLEHGPLFVYPTNEMEGSGLNAFDPKRGHFWTHASVYPWMYDYARHEWTWYLAGSGLNGHRWFYSTESGWYRMD